MLLKPDTATVSFSLHRAALVVLPYAVKMTLSVSQRVITSLLTSKIFRHVALVQILLYSLERDIARLKFFTRKRRPNDPVSN